MLSDRQRPRDMTFSVRNDVKGYAEIARPIDPPAVAIPGTPESRFRILPVVQELLELRFDLRHPPGQLLMEVSLHAALDIGSPVLLQVKPTEAGDRRIQGGSVVFTGFFDIGENQLLERVLEIR